MKRVFILFTGLLLIAISYRISQVERPDLDAYNFGLRAMRSGNSKAAFDMFRFCATNTTDQMLAARAEVAQGNLFLSFKEPKLAVDMYKRALRRKPNYLKAKYNLERLLVFVDQKNQGKRQTTTAPGDGSNDDDRSGKGQGRGGAQNDI